MNALTDQIITLLSSTLIAVMLIAAGIGVFRQSRPDFHQGALKWHVNVDNLSIPDLVLCIITILYFSMGAIIAAATPPGASAPPSLTNINITTWQVINGTCLNLVVALVLLGRMVLSGRIEALGLKKHSISTLIGLPVAGYLLVLGIHFCLDRLGLFHLIEYLTDAPMEQTIVSFLRSSHNLPLVLALCFSAGIAAPIVEELVFRGYLYPIMKKYTGAWFAVITTSLLFGVIHVSLIPLIPLAILAVVLVLMYEYTGSIWPPIITHCLFNAVTLVNVLQPGLFLHYAS